MTTTILHGDCLDVLPTLDLDSFHACVTDPPYHLTSIGRSIQHRRNGDGSDRTNQRNYAERGFMGKAWDGGDVALRPETWAEVLRVLRPGAHLLAFGGTRTYHRLACAIEDAGFEIRDAIMWHYGSGFPKSLDVSKAIDRAITAPATETARLWNGWGTALKPATEIIVVARKPLAEGTVAANVLEHGCGALNIDGCRVEGSWERNSTTRSDIRGGAYVQGKSGGLECDPQEAHALGRWPANVIHDGSEEVLAAFPHSVSSLPGNIRPSPSTADVYGEYRERSLVGHIDQGSVARFFYTAKADKQDRLGSKHPTVKPVDLLRYLVRLVTPPGGHVLDLFAGSGTTGMACMAEGFDCTLIERETGYVADIHRRIEHVSGTDLPLFAGDAMPVPTDPSDERVADLFAATC